jgi:mannose-6-phosphate isomerase-like protein (cupin superfamily)
MRYCLNRTRAEAVRVPGDTLELLGLFDDERGCETFAQRLLRFGPGSSRGRLEVRDDEVVYVLAGEGTLVIGEDRLSLQSGAGLFVSRGTRWSVEVDSELDLLSVLVHDPEPSGVQHALVDLASEERRSATAARQFVLGLTPEAGCDSVTQFIGFVPPGRAPDHFHRYDEVIMILDGHGVLHIGEEEAPLGPGSCVHLPSRLVHSLANMGETELRLLGVFRPAGSPAEAYYPDGTPATYSEES